MSNPYPKATPPVRIHPLPTQNQHGHQQPHQSHRPSQQTSTGAVPTSLDILFSYARGQLFYGSNLDTERAEPVYTDGLSSQDDNWSYASNDEEGSYNSTDDDENDHHDDNQQIDQSPITQSTSSIPPNRKSRRKSSRSDHQRPVQSSPSVGEMEGLDEMSPEEVVSIDDYSSGRDRTPMPRNDNRRGSYGFFSDPFPPSSPSSNSNKPTPTTLSSNDPSERTPLLISQQIQSSLPRKSIPRTTSSVSPHNNSPAPAHPASSTSPAFLDSNPSDSSRALGRRPPRRRSSRGIGPRGKATFAQAVVGTVSVMVGVSLLAMPYAFSQAGWIGAFTLLIGWGLVLRRTARHLAAITLSDPTLRSYADIARKAFGPKAIATTRILFCLELFVLSMSLLILMGDTLEIVLHSRLSSNQLKIIGGIVLFPTLFTPISVLSLSSVMSLISAILLFVTLALTLFLSLPQPSPLPQLSLLPTAKIFQSSGIVLSAFGIHAIIPHLVRDMKGPAQFGRVLDLSLGAACLGYAVVGAIGYWTLGRDVSGEITRNLSTINRLPPWIIQATLWLIAVTPLFKFPLLTRPLNITLENALRLYPPIPVPKILSPTSTMPVVSNHPKPASESSPPSSSIEPSASAASIRKRQSRTWKTIGGVVLARVGLTALCVGASIAARDYVRVVAFLGSFCQSLISVIIPLLAHSTLLKQSRSSLLLDRTLFLGSLAFMITGTVWVFLP
ncbi:Amino acid transporters [Phaffia rhodozyma]|uniref:Amino acid transporters n=1 Tax=Phaffia rhodozyma TaxID=264483 RepID=A0A0F7SWE4_PHARH|nr:Amino acid transporters [Phaffia rhodozyma]